MAMKRNMSELMVTFENLIKTVDLLQQMKQIYKKAHMHICYIFAIIWQGHELPDS